MTSSPPRRPFVASVAAVGAGALAWGAWLGWDHSASYDVVTRSVQSPYVTLQVLGCALTVGLLVVLLAARGHPVAGAAGVSVGFWFAWTSDAAATDDSGLYAVGALLLAFGLVAGTATCAAVGEGVRGGLVRRRTRRCGGGGAPV